ncbi:lysophospholipid acyltransferase family protein [Kitasatospora camelliae]|uniref:Lysophospholipid acyltransferase family protein n=1 Tax=Kitasatospora camelliae TaxID=3156397 RepID=A0AAU8JSH2_9ACTN
MNPWAVDAGCAPRCAAHPVPRVPAVRALGRCAALARTLAGGLAEGERIGDPVHLRARARGVLDALGIRLETGPEPLSLPNPHGAGTLVVANHISWLDVIALLAVEPVTPLAKREVGGWPVVGTLARRMGTRFIDREGFRQLPEVVAELSEVLRSGQSVTVFPQATTWCTPTGGRFRRAVFQAAIDAGAPVRPVTVDYRQEGLPTAVAAFLGDEGFATSLRRVAAARGLTVRVAVHPPLRGTDRRELAAEARASVCGTRLPVHA